MLFTIFRALWRIAIFVIGAYIIYFAVFTALPYFDERLPLAVSLFLLYCLLAYGAIPALVRLFRVFIKPNHIPMYSTTSDGWPSDPVNIAVVAHSRKHFVEAMTRAGWYVADKATLRNMLREGLAITFRLSYPTAPFSKLYLFGRPHDIGFQIPSNDELSPYSRHHVRFWRLELPESKAHHTHHTHYHYWVEKLKHLFGREREVWIGAAIEDLHAYGIRWRNGQITHRNNKDTDSERDLIIKTLEDAGLLRDLTIVQAGEPFQVRGQQFDNKFISDGTIRVLELRGPVATKLTPGRRSPR
ncbi:LssY C-terminal domain-containing protein [Candidatus Saccharibacteria bacterium]|nr:LssY C-terminal domain-containing protein [Candidatus Saccharibacteria bacterium]